MPLRLNCLLHQPKLTSVGKFNLIAESMESARIQSVSFLFRLMGMVIILAGKLTFCFFALKNTPFHCAGRLARSSNERLDKNIGFAAYFIASAKA